MKNIAVIPARSGSKGIKNKNIKLLYGKPLIAYTIEAALESKMFSEVHVSTDSEEYAEIAKSYGASVPFLRSIETAKDASTSWETVSEVLKKYDSMGQSFDTFALLQPTSPLRDFNDIVQAYNLFTEKKANCIVGVSMTDHSPLLCNTLDDTLSLKDFVSAKVWKLPRQKLPVYYRVNGAVYIVKTSAFINEFNLYGNGSYAYIMNIEKSIDIDTELDFVVAEHFINNKLN